MDTISTPAAASDIIDSGKPHNVLDTVEGEIHFFRSLMRARPVGVNRHFHVLSMQATIEKGVKQSVPVEDIWRKLEECYNLETLESLEAEYEQNADTPDSSTPQPAASPKEGDNLATHPFFHDEYSLPSDSYIESVVTDRRRATASPVSASSPVIARTPSEAPLRRGRKRKASAEPTKADLAGLVSGDSDSSDLTQQSGDEAEEETQTPSEKRATSVATGTDGGTDAMEEEEEEKSENEAPRPRRGGRKPARGRGRGTRKRKR